MSKYIIADKDPSSGFCKECEGKNSCCNFGKRGPLAKLDFSENRGFYCNVSQVGEEIPYKELARMRNETRSALKKKIFKRAMKYRRLRD